MCGQSRQEGYIVLSEVNEGIETVYQTIKDKDLYQFVTPLQAVELIDENAMLVVVDTHKAVPDRMSRAHRHDRPRGAYRSSQA